MKALKLTKPAGDVYLADVDIPEPGPGEVLMRIEASGLCHTDVHLADGDWPRSNDRLPRDLTLGHEAIGIVEALGEGVDSWAIGDRVAAAFLRSACGACKACRRGEENHCVRATTLGQTHHGSHAEYLVAVADFVVAVPDGVSPETAAPLCCAGLTVLGALRTAGVTVGTTLGVVGIGGQGHLAIQIAKTMGATVIAMDISTDKVALALRSGADQAYDVTDPDVLATAKALGLDVSMVTAPTDDAHALAIAVVSKGGTVSLCASPKGNSSISITEVGGKGLTLVGQAVGTRQDLVDCLALAATGTIECEVETRPLEAGVTSMAELAAAKSSAASCSSPEHHQRGPETQPCRSPRSESRPRTHHSQATRASNAVRLRSPRQ